MSTIYKDNEWSIRKNSKGDGTISSIPMTGKVLSFVSKVIETCIVFEIESSEQEKKIFVLADVSKSPIDFYYFDPKKSEVLDISEVTDIVPLSVISKIFKYVQERESELSFYIFKTTLYNNSSFFKGNYDTNGNILEIIKTDNKGNVIAKFNEGKIVIRFTNFYLENRSYRIQGFVFDDSPIFGFDYKSQLSSWISFRKVILENILKVIQDNEEILSEKYSKIDYQTYDTKKIGRGSTSFTFGNLPEKSGKRTLQFIEHIKGKINSNDCATRESFLSSINKPTYSGYLSSFFSAIKNAGLVDRIKNPSGSPKYCYVLGKNFKAWEEGRLKKIRG